MLISLVSEKRTTSLQRIQWGSVHYLKLVPWDIPTIQPQLPVLNFTAWHYFIYSACFHCIIAVFLVAAVVGMAGGVVSDQAEADEDMSVKQRLVLAGGSVLAEGGGAVGDLTGVDLAADGLEVAGE